MYKLTHNNIRLRYLAQRDVVKRKRAQGERVERFTYTAMGRLFCVTKQACYEWTKNKMPSGPRHDLVHQWINDGAIDAYMARLQEEFGEVPSA